MMLPVTIMLVQIKEETKEKKVVSFNFESSTTGSKACSLVYIVRRETRCLILLEERYILEENVVSQDFCCMNGCGGDGVVAV